MSFESLVPTRMPFRVFSGVKKKKRSMENLQDCRGLRPTRRPFTYNVGLSEDVRLLGGCDGGRQERWCSFYMN